MLQRITILSLILFIFITYQASSQGNVTYTIPLTVADPGKSFSMNDINKIFQMLPLTTEFSDPPNPGFFTTALIIQDLKITNFNFDDQQFRYQILNANNITYTANPNALTANYTFAWSFGSLGRTNATGVVQINEFAFRVELMKSQTSRLTLAAILESFAIRSMSITYGFQTAEEKAQLQKAQNLITNSSLPAFQTYITSQLTAKLFRFYSQISTRRLGVDGYVIWRQPRLITLTRLLGYELTRGPLIEGDNFIFEFSGHVNYPNINVNNLINMRVQSNVHNLDNFQEYYMQQILERQLQQTPIESCVAYKPAMIDSIIANSVAFYTPLMYFNTTLIQAFPQIGSFSPFYQFKAYELTMWGPDLWTFFAKTMGKNVTDASLIDTPVDLQCYNATDERIEITVNNVPKAKATMVDYGKGELSVGCNVRAQNTTDSTWIQLFGMRATFTFDMTLRYIADLTNYPNQLKGTAKNFKLLKVQELLGGPALDQKLLGQKVTKIVENLNFDNIEVMGDGIKGLTLVKDSITMAVDSNSGVTVCGDMRFDILNM